MGTSYEEPVHNIGTSYEPPGPIKTNVVDVQTQPVVTEQGVGTTDKYENVKRTVEHQM